MNVVRLSLLKGVSNLWNFILVNVSSDENRIGEPAPDAGNLYADPNYDPDIDERPGRDRIIDGSMIYQARDVMDAINEHFGRDVRPFSGTLTDQSIRGLTLRGIDIFINVDKTNEMTYVLDRGKADNWDCEQFAEKFRSNACSDLGINSVGIMVGNVHAWNVIVMVGDNGPGIIEVEPQNDGQITEIKDRSSLYAVDQRCEVYL